MLAGQLKDNLDILLIPKTKPDDCVPSVQFLLDGFVYFIYLFFVYSWQTNIIQCIQLK